MSFVAVLSLQAAVERRKGQREAKVRPHRDRLSHLTFIYFNYVGFSPPKVCFSILHLAGVGPSLFHPFTTLHYASLRFARLFPSNNHLFTLGNSPRLAFLRVSPVLLLSLEASLLDFLDISRFLYRFRDATPTSQRQSQLFWFLRYLSRSNPLRKTLTINHYLRIEYFQHFFLEFEFRCVNYEPDTTRSNWLDEGFSSVGANIFFLLAEWFRLTWCLDRVQDDLRAWSFSFFGTYQVSHSLLAVGRVSGNPHAIAIQYTPNVKAMCFIKNYMAWHEGRRCGLALFQEGGTVEVRIEEYCFFWHCLDLILKADLQYPS